MPLHDHTAVVTGATSGLGFATAARLGRDGWQRVVVTGRSEGKARSAASALCERTGRDVFEPLALDLADLDSVARAADALGRPGHIDLLLLNAGLLPGLDIVRHCGIERTFAASIVGHHALTLRLLRKGALAGRARIVISGSEAARDDVPLMRVVDLAAFAAEHTGHDRALALERIARAEAPWRFRPGDAYATAKAMVAWWAAALASRLPTGVTVNAVSPGNRPTRVTRNLPRLLHWLGPPVLKTLGGLLGIAGPIEDGVEHYLDAASWDDDRSGGFYASPPGKLVGPLVRQTQPHIVDEENHQAAWHALRRLAGAGDGDQWVMLGVFDT